MCVPVSAREVHDVGAVVKQAADQLAKEKPRKRERVKEAVREDR